MLGLESGAPPRRSPLLGLCAAVFLCMLPVTLVVPVLAQFVQQGYSVDDQGVSWFMSINMIAGALCAPLAGSTSDRLGRRRIPAAVALLVDGGLLAALSAAPNFASLLLLRALEGAAHGFALAIVLGMASDRAREGEARPGRVMGAVGAALTLGVAVGAPLGGWLGRAEPARALLVGGWIAAAGALVLALGLRDAPRTRVQGSTRGAIALLVGERRLLVPYAFAFVDRFTVGFFVTSFPLWQANVLDAAPDRIGLLLAAFLLPFSLGCYPAGRLAARSSPVRFLALGSLVYGLLVATLTLVPPALLAPWMILLGLASGVMFAPTLMLASRLAPEGSRAAAMGGFHAAGSLGFLVGPLVAGAITSGTWGDAPMRYSAAFATAGASELVLVLATLPALVRLARLEGTSGEMARRLPLR